MHAFPEASIEKLKFVPNAACASGAILFREEAERARRLAAAMRDRKVIEQLRRVAAIYDVLAVGQGVGPTDRD